MTIPDSFARLLADRGVQIAWLRTLGYTERRATEKMERANDPLDCEPVDDRPCVLPEGVNVECIANTVRLVIGGIPIDVDRSQSGHLRDALTAMLARTEEPAAVKRQVEAITAAFNARRCSDDHDADDTMALATLAYELGARVR